MLSDNSEQKSKDHTWTSKVVKKLKRLSLQSPATPSVEQTGAFGVELDKCVPSANNEVSLQELSVRFRAFSFRSSFRFQNDFHLTIFLQKFAGVL